MVNLTFREDKVDRDLKALYQQKPSKGFGAPLFNMLRESKIRGLELEKHQIATVTGMQITNVGAFRQRHSNLSILDTMNKWGR